jgi:formylmethanofuran dehydrogenase subunit A
VRIQLGGLGRSDIPAQGDLAEVPDPRRKNLPHEVEQSEVDQRDAVSARRVFPDRKVGGVPEEVIKDIVGLTKLATLDAARVWHLDHEVGSLTPGKHADVTVVDMRPPHLDGFGDPVATLVMGAGAADVETVVLGGEIVKAGGVLVGVAERARELMHESRANLRNRTGKNPS